MLRFNVWLRVTRGSRKAGGSWQQLWHVAVDIATIQEKINVTGREPSENRIRRSASKVLDAKPFALRSRIASHLEGCPDNGSKISDLHLSRGSLPPLDAIRYL